MGVDRRFGGLAVEPAYVDGLLARLTGLRAKTSAQVADLYAVSIVERPGYTG